MDPHRSLPRFLFSSLRDALKLVLNCFGDLSSLVFSLALLFCDAVVVFVLVLLFFHSDLFNRAGYLRTILIVVVGRFSNCSDRPSIFHSDAKWAWRTNFPSAIFTKFCFATLCDQNGEPCGEKADERIVKATFELTTATIKSKLHPFMHNLYLSDENNWDTWWMVVVAITDDLFEAFYWRKLYVFFEKIYESKGESLLYLRDVPIEDCLEPLFVLFRVALLRVSYHLR